MTPLQKQRAKVRKEKQLAKRLAAKARQRARMEVRKAKRAIKAAPRLRLRVWAAEVTSVGRCAVCGAVPRKITTKIRIKNGVRVGGKPFTVGLNAHHLLPKERYPEFKFERMNGVCLCPTCHKFGKYSAHRNPIWFVLWLRKHRPEQFQWCKQRIGSRI